MQKNVAFKKALWIADIVNSEVKVLLNKVSFWILDSKLRNISERSQ